MFKDFAGRGERFGKDRRFVGNFPRDFVKISRGQSDELGEGTRSIDDPYHCAMLAVASKPATTPLAGLAGDVDLPYHSLADPAGVVTFHHFTHELVSGNAAEARIAFEDLAVGTTDAGEHHRKQSFP